MMNSMESVNHMRLRLQSAAENDFQESDGSSQMNRVRLLSSCKQEGFSDSRNIGEPDFYGKGFQSVFWNMRDLCLRMNLNKPQHNLKLQLTGRKGSNMIQLLFRALPYAVLNFHAMNFHSGL